MTQFLVKLRVVLIEGGRCAQEPRRSEVREVHRSTLRRGEVWREQRKAPAAHDTSFDHPSRVDTHNRCGMEERIKIVRLRRLEQRHVAAARPNRNVAESS